MMNSFIPVQANLDLRKSILFDLRNVYVMILNISHLKKECPLQVNLQVEIVLKSRIHCTNLHTRAEYVIRFKCFKAKNKN